MSGPRRRGAGSGALLRSVVVTCEHASNDVPPELRGLFRPHAALRRTHRGFDEGALPLAQALAAALAAPLVIGRWSRLVVDLNRSPSNRAVFSEVTRPLEAGERRRLLEVYHAPYRTAVERLVAGLIGGRGALGVRVLHLSVHTFTDVLDGRVRDVDVAFLFDPARAAEDALARAWRRALAAARPDLRVGLNRPYRGTSDGMTTHLRRRHPAARYAGIEIEVIQSLARRPAARARLAGDLLATLAALG